MRLVPVLLALVVAALVAAPAAMAATPTATIAAADSTYGTVLFDGDGRALYLFTKEKPGDKPACYGDCAAAWPPVLTGAAPEVGDGAKAKHLGTVRRRGGGPRQVTYRGRPLYYYVTDTRPGQITCQDVFEFGGDWLVVSPAGRPVR